MDQREAMLQTGLLNAGRNCTVQLPMHGSSSRKETDSMQRTQCTVLSGLQ